jgi:hypothetical protein
VTLDEADYDIDAVHLQRARPGQHGVGLSDARGRSQENAQLAAFLFLRQRENRSPFPLRPLCLSSPLISGIGSKKRKWNKGRGARKRSNDILGLVQRRAGSQGRWDRPPISRPFGSATDPVAIIAMFKDHGLEGRLRLLVESESPFKDGVAAVLFVAALSWAQGDGGGPASFETAGALARIAFGGVAIGILCAGATILVAWRTSERMIEAALTTVAAFGSFFIAEQFSAGSSLIWR